MGCGSFWVILQLVPAGNSKQEALRCGILLCVAVSTASQFHHALIFRSCVHYAAVPAHCLSNTEKLQYSLNNTQRIQ